MVRVLWWTALLLGLGLPGAARGQESGVEVPLGEHGGRLWVPVQAANGAELHFLIGTGSAITLLSERGAGRLSEGGAPTVGDLPIALEGSRTASDESLTADGKTFDGLIGSNTLSGYDLLIDLPNSRLVLRAASGRAAEWAGQRLSEPVRLRIYHGVIIGLDVELGGRPYPAMLDPGTPGILVNRGVLTDLGIADGDPADLQLGTESFTALRVRESDHPAIGRFSPDGAGFVLVGSAIALDCALALSWVRQELRTCVR